MQAEYDFNDNEIDENHRGNSRLHPPLIVSRFHGTQQPWKRSYTVSSGKDNEHKNNRHLSTGGGVALIFALAGMLYSFLHSRKLCCVSEADYHTVGIAFIVLVIVFLVFRKRYGPRYTVRSFFSGLRPERHRVRGSKTSSMPMVAESGFPCKDAFPQRRGTKLTKTSLPSGQSATRSGALLMSGARLAQGQSQSHQMQPIHEPGPARLSRPSSAITANPNRLSVPSTTRSSYLRPFTTQQYQQQNHITEYNNNNNMTTTTTPSRRKNPPSPLRQLPRLPTTDHLKALTPATPHSNHSRFTTSTKSSGPLPPIPTSGTGHGHRRDPSHATTTMTGDRRWSYFQNCNNSNNNIHDARSVVGSEDRVVSLPSPSPILRNIIQPPLPRATRDDGESSYYHVCRLMMRVSNGGQRRSQQRQTQCWEMDSRHSQQEQQEEEEEEEPQSPLRYEQTEDHAHDGGLPMLPRSVFAMDSNQYRKPYGS